METSKRILQKRYQGKKNSDSNAKGEYVVKPELGRKSKDLLRIVSADCVKNSNRQYNIFWLNAVNIW